MFKEVAEIEKITNATELILQTRSIYSEAYRPKYIEEMNDIEKIKELSDVIQDRLRNVKLAVSKANLNQSKMIDLTKKKEENKTRNQYQTSNIKIVNKETSLTKKKLGPVLTKSKSALDILKKRTENSEKKEQSITNTLLADTNNQIENQNQNQEIEQEQQINKTRSEISVISGLKKNLLPKYPKMLLPKIKSKYAMSKRKLRTPGDFFNMYQDEFAQGYKELFSPIKILFAKTKEKKKQLIRSNSNIVLPGFKPKKPVDPEEEEERLRLEELQRKRKISMLEKNLKYLEKHAQ